jgi:hypothetical protein
MIRRAVILLLGGALSACATSISPTKMGGDTYFSSKPNRAGIFGDPTSLVGELIVEGNQFCQRQEKELEMVTKEVIPLVAGVRSGSASITFRCVNRSQDVRLRPEPQIKIEMSR